MSLNARISIIVVGAGLWSLNCPAIYLPGTNDVILVSGESTNRAAQLSAHPIEWQQSRIRLQTDLPAGCRVHFDEGRAPIRVNGQWGFVDTNLVCVIPPIYPVASRFSAGLAAVSNNKRWGYIDPEGKVVIPLEYEWAYGFRHGVGSVRKDGRFGLIDKTGRWVMTPKYDAALDPHANGYEGQYKNGLTECLDTNLKVVGRYNSRTGEMEGIRP